MTKQNDNQNGVISFLSVIFISLLLIVVTTGFIRVMLNEQRQSTDFDQSTKAFYLAETGVENAVKAINDGVALSSGCDSSLDDDGDTLTETDITCVVVDPDYPAAVTSDLAAGESLTIDLSNASAFDAIEIRWHQDEVRSDIPAYGTNNAPSTWIDGSGVALPAALKTSLIRHPNGTAITNKTFILWPNDNTGSANATQRDQSGVSSVEGVGGDYSTQATVVNAHCSPQNLTATDYACRAQITGITSTEHTLNIKSFNSYSTTLSVIALNAGNPVSINQDIFGIDSTARAGDIFRRVVSTYNVGEPKYFKNFGYDYVIYGDEQVCKQLTVLRDTSNNALGASTNDPRC